LAIAEPDAGTQDRIVDAYTDCRRLATEFDVAVSDRDKELLGRLYHDT
jgi:hypothetical protein